MSLQNNSAEVLEMVRNSVFIKNEKNLGSIGSSSAGATAAGEEHIHILDNCARQKGGFSPPA